jgi:hypothetical protein
VPFQEAPSPNPLPLKGERASCRHALTSDHESCAVNA